MSLSPDTGAAKKRTAKSQAHTRLDTFPIDSIFTSVEQMQRFELLRLAFFVLKLRKLDEQPLTENMNEQEQHLSFQRNLLQHAIFQQVLTLTKLDAREQAMQIISACHNTHRAQTPEE